MADIFQPILDTVSVEAQQTASTPDRSGLANAVASTAAATGSVVREVGRAYVTEDLTGGNAVAGAVDADPVLAQAKTELFSNLSQVAAARKAGMSASEAKVRADVVLQKKLASPIGQFYQNELINEANQFWTGGSFDAFAQTFEEELVEKKYKDALPYVPMDVVLSGDKDLFVAHVREHERKQILKEELDFLKSQQEFLNSQQAYTNAKLEQTSKEIGIEQSKFNLMQDQVQWKTNELAAAATQDVLRYTANKIQELYSSGSATPENLAALKADVLAQMSADLYRADSVTMGYAQAPVLALFSAAEKDTERKLDPRYFQNKRDEEIAKTQLTFFKMDRRNLEIAAMTKVLNPTGATALMSGSANVVQDVMSRIAEGRSGTSPVSVTAATKEYYDLIKLNINENLSKEYNVPEVKNQINGLLMGIDADSKKFKYSPTSWEPLLDFLGSSEFGKFTQKHGGIDQQIASDALYVLKTEYELGLKASLQAALKSQGAAGLVELEDDGGILRFVPTTTPKKAIDLHDAQRKADTLNKQVRDRLNRMARVVSNLQGVPIQQATQIVAKRVASMTGSEDGNQ